MKPCMARDPPSPRLHTCHYACPRPRPRVHLHPPQHLPHHLPSPPASTCPRRPTTCPTTCPHRLHAHAPASMPAPTPAPTTRTHLPSRDLVGVHGGVVVGAVKGQLVAEHRTAPMTSQVEVRVLGDVDCGEAGEAG